MQCLFAVHTFAIEGLKLSVHCPDVWLSWPSAEGETYIVQFRETLDTNSAWITLTNGLPAQTGTNLTTFIHSNRVDCPTGQIFGMMFTGGGAGSAETLIETKQAEAKLTEPMVIAKDGSKQPVPLAIYPPGIDLSGQLILWPDGSFDEWSAELMEKWSAAQREEKGDPQTEDSGGNNPSCGFYRVVRSGVKLWGITNGTVLSGVVSLPFEYGIGDTNRSIDQVFLTDDDSDTTLPGASFPAFPLKPGELPVGEWDTTQATNGNYALQLGVLLDDGSVFMDAPVSVTVSNLIYQSDPWNVGGAAIYVGFKTVFTNGSWHLDAYDSEGTYIGYLEGYIDSDGWCNYPGIPGPGFSVDNTDPYGNQYSSPNYTLVMTVMPSGAAPPYPVVTNKVFIEPAWNYHPRAITCYQQVFPSWAPGADDLRILMEAVWSVVEIYHQNLLGGATAVYEVNTWGWGQVTNNMVSLSARDFVYFGHGSGTSLGGGGLTISMVKALLGNNLKDPLTATNMHPYRFVFLDGCNTADGDWPQAFGIPKKKGMVITDFTHKRGIRPRAFMGWNRKKVVGIRIIAGNQLYTPHAQYITKFWDWWSNGGTGLRPVKGAIDQARNTAPLAAEGMVLYGAEDLVINY